MKLIIMGASGNIGRMIVPELAGMGASLLLLGRDTDVLGRLFPGHKTADNSQLKTLAADYDGLLFLPVLNNDKEGTLDEFNDVNVALLQQILEDVSECDLGFFLYPSSLHATCEKNASHYSRTKKTAEKLLLERDNSNTKLLILPAVYGENYSGRLSLLYNVPRVARHFVFNILRCFKPTVNIRKVAEVVINGKDNPDYQIITDRQQGNWIYHFVIRFIDIVFALFVIVGLWWLLLLCMAAIRVSSSGPAIFKQKRVGRFGKPFTCYKLRTMKSGTAQLGTHEVDAVNITGIGRFLRASKIDELPQSYNILRGEMSLVGPRPCLFNQLEIIRTRQSRGIFDHRPGITGWSQIHSIDMSDPEKLAKSDEYYLNMQTLVMQMRIVLLTIFGKPGFRLRD